MTLYAVKAVGFDKGSEITLFLVLTIPSIFGSYIYGHLVDRFGAKRSLMTTLVLWIVLLAVMIAVPGKNAFWLVGLAIGLNFGGVPTAERPVLLGLVPDVEAGRYFSLMLLSSRAAAIAGPLIWGITVDGLESTLGTAIAYRAAVMTVAVDVRDRGVHSSRRSRSIVRSAHERVRAAARDRRDRAALVLSRHPGRGPRAHSATTGRCCWS